MVIGVLSVVLILLVLSLFILSPLFREVPVIITYESSAPAEEELQAELRAARAGKREKVDKDW